MYIIKKIDNKAHSDLNENEILIIESSQRLFLWKTSSYQRMFIKYNI
jgi:hypothetical protein